MTDMVNKVALVIGVIVALGGIVAYLRSAGDKGTIASLKEYAATSDMRLEQLEKIEARLTAEAAAEKIRHAAEIEALQLRVTALEADNTLLRAQRPSAEMIAGIDKTVHAVHSDTTKLVKALEETP